MKGDADIKPALQQLDDYEFEKFLGDLWAADGWDTRVLQASNDRGIDVEATKFDPIEEKHLIQAKRYSDGNNVGSKEVQQYSSLRRQENADVVIIVTTSGFTRQAEERAEDLNVKLIDGDDLVQLINSKGATDLLEKYVEATVEPGDESSPGPSSPRKPPTLEADRLPGIYLSKLVEQAAGRLVTENRLTKLKPGKTHPQTLSDRPIIEYLYKDEQPHFTFRCDKIKIPARSTAKPKHGAYLVVTDRRVLVLVGTDDGDKEIEIAYTEINDVDWSDFPSQKIILATTIGEYRFKIDHLPQLESSLSWWGAIKNPSSWEQPDESGMDAIITEMQNCVEFIKHTAYSMM